MRMRIVAFSIFSLVIFYSCGTTESDTSEIVELKIDHYQTVASGPFQGLFYLTQSGEKIGSGNWDIQYSPITNFDYEWGYRYKILAEKRKYNEGDEPLMDTPAYKYVFVEELSKTKVNTDLSFEILLQRAYDDGGTENYIQGNVENGFTLLGTKPFDCANLCDELAAERKPNTYLTGIFRHKESGDIKLVDLRNEDL